MRTFCISHTVSLEKSLSEGLEFKFTAQEKLLYCLGFRQIGSMVIVRCKEPLLHARSRIMDLCLFYSFFCLDTSLLILRILSKTVTLGLNSQPLGILSCTKVNYVAVMHYVRQHSLDNQSLSAQAGCTGSSSSSPIPLHCSPCGDLREDHSRFTQGHPALRAGSPMYIYYCMTQEQLWKLLIFVQGSPSLNMLPAEL